jgi:hypothetical protein
MIDFLFSTVWGWIGIAGVIAVACMAVAWFVPPLRTVALAVGGAAIAAATIYTKGSRDRAALEQKRKDEAVKKAREKFDAIDARPDDPKTVKDRLDRGTF